MRSYCHTTLSTSMGAPFVESYLEFMAGFGSTPVGNLTGVGLEVINAPPSTLDDLSSFLRQFTLARFLKIVGGVAGEYERGLRRLHGVEVRSYSLAYLALVAVEASSDQATSAPSRADVARALRKFYGLPEPLLTEVDARPDAALEHAIRASYVQLSGNVNLGNVLARAWLIYGVAWARSAKSALFGIASAIADATGLTLEQLMFLGYAFSGQAHNQGYVTPYATAKLASLPGYLGIGEAEQARFLDWSTASYDQIRRAAASFPVPSRDYEKYRLSPFVSRPLVRADALPAEAPTDALLAPAPAYLARRVTEGVFHALSGAHQGVGSKNPFRTAFGYAFQEYVGMLLEAGSLPGSVLAEWKYPTAAGEQDTPDWLVLDGDRVIVIEVKTSVVDLKAKVLGHLELVAKSLKRNLAKAADQLLTFRSDVERQASGLERLANVREFELLVVTHDEAHFANWVMREQVAREIEGASDVHICSVDDFEELQRYYWQRSLFDALRAKRQGDFRDQAYGVREWVEERAVPSVARHPLLASTFDALIDAWTQAAEPR